MKEANEREVEKSVNKKFIDASEECLPSFARGLRRGVKFLAVYFSAVDVANKPWVFQISTNKSNGNKEGEEEKSYFGTCGVSLYLVHTN